MQVVNFVCKTLIGITVVERNAFFASGHLQESYARNEVCDFLKLDFVSIDFNKNINDILGPNPLDGGTPDVADFDGVPLEFGYEPHFHFGVLRFPKPAWGDK